MSLQAVLEEIHQEIQPFLGYAWSPGLDPHGNSLAGVKALELFTTKTGLSIF